MCCLVTKHDIEAYKQELIGSIQSMDDLIHSLNTVSSNVDRINKQDLRIMLNIIVLESRKCVA